MTSEVTKTVIKISQQRKAQDQMEASESSGYLPSGEPALVLLHLAGYHDGCEAGSFCVYHI